MEILKDLGIFALISSAITILLRSFINKYFDKKSDIFKTELQKELEKFKNDLNIQNFRTTKFHEKELEALSDLFKKITVFKNYLIELTSTLEIKLVDNDNNKELIEKCKTNISNSYKNFRDYYDSKRIFIPKKTCKLIDNFIEKSSSIIFNYHYRDNNYERDNSFDSNQIIKEIRKKMRDDIPNILNELENDFRLSINNKK